jgi:hypothetical protein
MSRKRRPPTWRNRKVTRCKVGRIEKTSVRERTVPRAGAEFSEFLRSRDPQVMGPLMLALNKSRTLFSWLTPGTRVIGVPEWAGEDLPWLTLIDDLHAEVTGPTSFDQRSLEWWTKHAVALIVDAAKALPNFYEFLGSSVAAGQRALLVQTVEVRRLLWHEYFRSARAPGVPAVVIDLTNKPESGVSRQLLRVGRLGDDFGPNGPSSPGSFGALAPSE